MTLRPTTLGSPWKPDPSAGEGDWICKNGEHHVKGKQLQAKFGTDSAGIIKLLDTRIVFTKSKVDAWLKHELDKQMREFKKTTFRCDICRAKIPSDSAMYVCHECDYHVCKKCRNFSSAYVCPGMNHPLISFRAEPQITEEKFMHWKCNECKKGWPPGTTMYGCRECDYDVCKTCQKPAISTCTFALGTKGIITIDENETTQEYTLEEYIPALPSVVFMIFPLFVTASSVFQKFASVFSLTHQFGDDLDCYSCSERLYYTDAYAEIAKISETTAKFGGVISGLSLAAFASTLLTVVSRDEEPILEGLKRVANEMREVALIKPATPVVKKFDTTKEQFAIDPAVSEKYKDMLGHGKYRVLYTMDGSDPEFDPKSGEPEHDEYTSEGWDSSKTYEAEESLDGWWTSKHSMQDLLKKRTKQAVTDARNTSGENRSQQANQNERPGCMCTAIVVATNGGDYIASDVAKSRIIYWIPKPTIIVKGDCVGISPKSRGTIADADVHYSWDGGITRERYDRRKGGILIPVDLNEEGETKHTIVFYLTGNNRLASSTSKVIKRSAPVAPTTNGEEFWEGFGDSMDQFVAARRHADTVRNDVFL
jgi:hypothetical protein